MSSWQSIIIGSTLCLLIVSASTMAQQTRSTAEMNQPKQIFLYPNGAPGAAGNEAQDRPTLDIYLPEKAKAVGTAVVVLPGGGYGFLAVDHEGKQIAEWLNTHGIAAFVLKYRIAPRYRHPAPLQDAQQAIRYVRANAAGFGVRA
jgi:acetyl esterase/lipase